MPISQSDPLEFSSLFSASGLRTAPAQVWRGLRLVPILSDRIQDDLRLARRVYDGFLTFVDLPQDKVYFSFVPHAYVLEYNPEGLPLAAPQTQLSKADGQRWKGLPVRSLQRMAKHEKGPAGQRLLRFLPLHLAMEGYLTAYFNAPRVDWRDDYLRYAISHGLDPRIEYTLPGRCVDGLEEALRIFEIHPQQVGMLLFIAEALAAVMIYPHPADYRLLHRSLLEDFFGEVVGWYYAHLPYRAPQLPLAAAGEVNSWAEVRARLEQLSGELDAFQRTMASGVLASPVRLREVQGLGPYRLQSFISELRPDEGVDAHIGEAIIGSEGRLAYLKTCTLTRDQIRRAWFLERLDAHDWSLDLTAAAMNLKKDALVLKLDACGLGRLLQPKVIEQARKRLG
ncbi:MAG TPA: hypothetical protein V6D23_09365 [Candidatus Obscuribacterales bacterium]